MQVFGSMTGFSKSSIIVVIFVIVTNQKTEAQGYCVGGKTEIRTLVSVRFNTMPCSFSFTLLKKLCWLGVVAHAYNPSPLGGQGG